MPTNSPGLWMMLTQPPGDPPSLVNCLGAVFTNKKKPGGKEEKDKPTPI